MSMEEKKDFKLIENMEDYVKKGIISGKIIVNEGKKTAKIHARKGIVGEKITTITSEGTVERKDNTVTADVNGHEGMVVTNPMGEQYIVPWEEFKAKYEEVPNHPGEYMPKGKPTLLLSGINENIEFGHYKLVAGGSLVMRRSTNGMLKFYPIQAKELAATYEITDKKTQQCREDAIALMGITKEELESAGKTQSSGTEQDDDDWER